MKLAHALVVTAGLVLASAAYAGHHEAAEEKAVDAGAPQATDSAAESSLSDTAKRAGAKGAETGADSLMGGATMQDSAKQGGAAALDEALRPAAPGADAVTPEAPAVSAPPAE
jgi:hypothetical protein